METIERAIDQIKKRVKRLKDDSVFLKTVSARFYTCAINYVDELYRTELAMFLGTEPYYVEYELYCRLEGYAIYISDLFSGQCLRFKDEHDNVIVMNNSYSAVATRPMTMHTQHFVDTKLRSLMEGILTHRTELHQVVNESLKRMDCCLDLFFVNLLVDRNNSIFSRDIRRRLCRSMNL